MEWSEVPEQQVHCVDMCLRLHLHPVLCLRLRLCLCCECSSVPCTAAPHRCAVWRAVCAVIWRSVVLQCAVLHHMLPQWAVLYLFSQAVGRTEQCRKVLCERKTPLVNRLLCVQLLRQWRRCQCFRGPCVGDGVIKRQEFIVSVHACTCACLCAPKCVRMRNSACLRLISHACG